MSHIYNFEFRWKTCKLIRDLVNATVNVKNSIENMTYQKKLIMVSKKKLELPRTKLIKLYHRPNHKNQPLNFPFYHMKRILITNCLNDTLKTDDGIKNRNENNCIYTTENY